MANTSTLIDTLPISVYGASSVEMYVVNIDTVDTDLTIRAAVAGKFHAMVGFLLDDSANSVVTFKSNTTTIATLEKGYSYNSNIGDGVILTSKIGEGLVIRSTHAIDAITIYVIVTDQILIR